MTWPTPVESLEALGQSIVANSAGAIESYEVSFGELALTAPAPRIVQALTHLRDHADCQFQQLIELTAIDYPTRARRFDVVYLFLSLTKNQRCRLSIQVDDGEAVASATGVYPCADWSEREVFDMYGIAFEGHPDLRRILTDYGFEGHPLRKDFPMTGYVELRYDDDLKRVVYEPVKSVEFRNWDFLSPWEGAEYAKPGQGYPYVLPGDEKAGAK